MRMRTAHAADACHLLRHTCTCASHTCSLHLPVCADHTSSSRRLTTSDSVLPPAYRRWRTVENSLSRNLYAVPGVSKGQEVVRFTPLYARTH